VIARACKRESARNDWGRNLSENCIENALIHSENLIIMPMTAQILVVDDSGFSRRILRHILEEAGYSVDEAQDGMEALERYALARPQVVLLDVVMNGMTGLEVLAKLRELDPKARVVLATADVQSSTAATAREAGAAGIICKPFQKERVIQAIAAVEKGEPAWS